MLLVPPLRRQIQAYLCEIQPILVSIESSRIAVATRTPCIKRLREKRMRRKPEIAQLVKYLPGKPEDLSLNCQHPCKKLGMVVVFIAPSARRAESGRSLELAGQLIYQNR